MPGFEERLVQLREGNLLERGDIVFEKVDHAPAGAAERRISWKRWKVIDTDRAAARLTDPDGGGRPTKIHFRFLYREQEPEKVVPEKKQFNAPRLVSKAANGNGQASAPATSTKAPEKQASSTADVDDELAAWLDQGKGLLRDVERKEADLAEQMHGLDAELEAIDKRYRARIEELEAELEETRRAHADDRALAATRRDSLESKKRALSERRAGIEGMLAQGGSR